MADILIFTADSAERLDRFLARLLPELSRTRLSDLAAEGAILVDGVARKGSYALRQGMTVKLERPAEKAPHDLEPADIPLRIVFEDEYLLIVDKPRGLATHPATSLKEPSLVNALLARGQPLSEGGESFRPGIVHRLDKETTGLLVIAKTDAAHVELSSMIERRELSRRYFALVGGQFDQPRFTVDAPIGRDQRNRQRMAVVPRGKRAVTHFRRVAETAYGTLLGAKLETGRTHQIRVHLAAIGHPVIGDRTYGRAKEEGPMALHAAFLAFEHPITGIAVRAFSRPPEDFPGYDRCSESDLDPWD